MKQVEIIQDTISVILATVAGMQIYSWAQGLNDPLFFLVMGFYFAITYFIAGVAGIHLYQNWVEGQSKNKYTPKGGNQNAGNQNQPKQGN